MKIQWLAEFNPSNFHSLEDVRNDLFKYVNKYNNTPHSSLEYRTPQDRFFKESSLIRKLSDDSISRNFLMEIERRVTGWYLSVIACLKLTISTAERRLLFDILLIYQMSTILRGSKRQALFLIKPENFLPVSNHSLTY